MPFGFLARYVDDIVKTVGKTIKETSPELISGLKNWLRGPAKTAAEIKNIYQRNPVEKIVADMDLFKSKMTGDFEGITNQLASHKSIIDGRLKIQNEIAERVRELDRLNRRLIARRGKVIKGPEEELAIGREVDSLTDTIYKLKNNLNIKRVKEKKLNEFQSLIETMGPHKALQQLKNNPDLKRKIPGLDAWFSEADSVLAKWHQNYKLTSNNIDKAKKFVKELKIYSERDPKLLAQFLENPANQAYLIELRNTGPRSLRELIAKIEGVTLARPSFLEKTTEVAKKIGVGAGVLGTGGAAVGIFNWLNNSAKEEVSESMDMLSMLNNIETSDKGLLILDNAKKSVIQIRQLSDKLDDDMEQDPKKATEEYLYGISKEMSNLSNYLNQWNVVIKFSSNKQEAELVGNEIAKYLKRAQENFAKLGAQIGQPISAKLVSYVPPTNKDIGKIQELLRQRGYNIPLSGEIDNSTIAALESLEREYQSKAPNYDLGGSFVNRQTGNIISYNDLLNALNILEK